MTSSDSEIDVVSAQEEEQTIDVVSVFENEKTTHSRKRKSLKYSHLDEELAKWVREKRNEKHRVSRRIIHFFVSKHLWMGKINRVSP